jgi:glyoxylase-like metal-dependent hydrolase (beta-lactamase superfamily II)
MPGADYIATRRIGEATITLINDGVFERVPLVAWLDAPEEEVRRAVPEADADGAIGNGMIVAHVKLGAASILVDPGFGKPTPDSWLITELKLHSTAGVQAGLAAAGIQPEEITHVVITHAHGDHYTGATVLREGRRVPRYPNARYVIGRADWEGNPERDAPDSEVSLHLGTLARLGRLDLADGDYEVVPGVTMLAAPGESPGHCIVRVASAGERFYHLGDLYHHTCEAEHLDWVIKHARTERDKPAMRASRRRFLAEAVPSQATLVFTHAVFPGWGRVVASAGGYRWESV